MAATDLTLQSKYAKVQQILRSLESVAVAFSAGVDSTLVLKIAIDVLGSDHVVAVTGRSDSLAAAELEQAGQLAQQLGARHVVLETTEFDNEDYVSNPTNRCFYCKTTLYDHMARFIADHGIKAMVNGANVDDLGDYRPGLQAASQHQVHAPLAQAGFTKEDVRALSRQLDLPTYDKPASPCLSSRVQYGERITPEKLRMIERAEQFLRSLGIRECRVRHHDRLARIEVKLDDLHTILQEPNRSAIDDQFRQLGYQYVTVDLRGLRSGSMNEVIQIGLSRPG